MLIRHYINVESMLIEPLIKTVCPVYPYFFSSPSLYDTPSFAMIQYFFPTSKLGHSQSIRQNSFIVEPITCLAAPKINHKQFYHINTSVANYYRPCFNCTNPFSNKASRTQVSGQLAQRKASGSFEITVMVKRHVYESYTDSNIVKFDEKAKSK